MCIRDRSKDAGRKIPEMVKGTVKDQHTKGQEQGQVFIMACINTKGQIKEDGKSI